MPKKTKINLVYKGANTDTDIEITPLEEGVFYSSINMRPTRIGSKSSMHSIKEELVDHVQYNKDEDTFTDSYGEPIGGIRINDYTILVWAHLVNEDPFMTINGHTVLSSPNLLFDIDYPLEMIASESGDNITLFLNDRNTPPLIFDLNDLISEAGDYDPSGTRTQKYFDDFILADYTPQLNTPQNKPMFKELIPTSNTGLSFGKYSYQIRYVNEDGSSTAWSLPTMLIPVMEYLDNPSKSTSGPFPRELSYGGESGGESNYGIRISIRISNKWGYDFIQIKRSSYTTGEQYSGTSTVETYDVPTVDIKETPFTVIDFDDSGNIEWVAYDNQLDENTSIISKAGGIRYFKDRFIIMNPTYYSKVLDSTDLFLDSPSTGKLAYPVIENLGNEGFANVKNQVEKLSLMHGERYGWYAVGIDSSGGRSFAIPYKSADVEGVTDFTNYMIPNRREAVSAETEAAGDSVLTSDIDSSATTSVSKTHEVSKDDSVLKDDSYSVNVDVDYAYKPFTPTGDKGSHLENNINKDGLNINPVAEVDGVAYAPKGFRHDYHTSGMRFLGVDPDVFPDYIKSFSIVRTEPAGRVVCQGIGAYSLEGGITYREKALNKFWFYSPDIDPLIGINPGIYQDIIDNPDDYQIQLVAPLGFFTEKFGGVDSIGDIICHTFQDEYINSEHNPWDVASQIGQGDGYVAFGKWRNTAVAAAAVSGSTEYIYDISSAEVNVHGERNGSLNLTIGSNIYAAVAQPALATNNGARPWHEPVYVINIVKVGNHANTNSIISCVDTGHIQHLNSLIGLGTGEAVNFPLVDERDEDVAANGTFNGYVYVNGKAWATSIPHPLTNDITGYNTLMSSFAGLGYYDDGVKLIYGLCRLIRTTSLGKYTISFDQQYWTDLYTAGISSLDFIPELDDIIEVRYDNRAPIDVFGGDTYIGNVLAPMIDINTSKNETLFNIEQELFFTGIALPYAGYKYNAEYRRMLNHKDGASTSTIDSTTLQYMTYLRQMAFLFIGESKMNLNLLYNDSYPRKNYVERPNLINDSGWEGKTAAEIYEEALVSDGYLEDYGDEYLYWTWGGIHFPGRVNFDYGKQLSAGRYSTKPAVGFTERVNYPNDITWSLVRGLPGVNNALKSFPVLNKYTMSDKHGEIKMAFNATTSKGDNLYAICNTGIAILFTEKGRLYQSTGEFLASAGADTFIAGEEWLADSQGMDYDNWRTAAEYKGTLFFANSKGVFMLVENTIKEIDVGFRKVIDSDILPNLLGSTVARSINAVIDYKNKEYQLHIMPIDEVSSRIYIFSMDTMHWIGYHNFRLFKLISDEHNVYSVSIPSDDWSVNKVGAGANYLASEITLPILPEFGVEVEPIDVKIYSDYKPTSVDFSRTIDAIPECTLSVAKGASYLKDYGYWGNKVPRIASTNYRLQSRVLIVRVAQAAGTTALNIRAAGIKYVPLKHQ